MADVFNEDQFKRLFGAISIGGTLGAVVGAAVTESLTTGSQGVMLEPSSLLIIMLVSLELAVLCMLAVANLFNLTKTGGSPREPGPRFAEGLRLIARVTLSATDLCVHPALHHHIDIPVSHAGADRCEKL